MTVESAGNCSARGSRGERGLMQVNPATARSVDVTGNLFDCRVGAEAAVKYLKLALRRSGGNYAIGAALYNKRIYGRPAINGNARKVMKLIR
jgi:soluble lytic murein transglycosylase-like protein